MKHEMKLREKYFECIKKGTKIIELRLYDEKRREISIGDEIEFLKEPDKIEKMTAKVEGLLLYSSFEKILEDYPIEWFADSETTKNELLEVLNTFYSKEEQSKYGILGIRIVL